MVYYERAKIWLSNLDELEGLFQPDPASIAKNMADISCPQTVLSSCACPLFAHQWSRHCAGTVVKHRQVDFYHGRFRLRGAQSRYMRQDDAPSLGRVWVNRASPQYRARFGYPENLTTSPHMRWYYSLTPGSLFTVLPFETPRYVVVKPAEC